MAYFKDTLRALATTLKNVARKPATVEFPQVIRPRAERYRSGFALLHDAPGDELCIGCLQCEKICPSQVIAVKQSPKRASPVTGKLRGYADAFILDTSACIFCELCVQVCPVDALVMTRQPEPPTFSREELVFDMPRLYANEKLRERSWAHGTRLVAMQQPPPPPKPAPATPAASTAPAVDAQEKK